MAALVRDGTSTTPKKTLPAMEPSEISFTTSSTELQSPAYATFTSSVPSEATAIGAWDSRTWFRGFSVADRRAR